MGDYEEAIEEIFTPIEYKGFRIGITICYDSNKSIFSKAYDDIDLLLNLTGGHVDYKKWSIYQRARALENKCNCRVIWHTSMIMQGISRMYLVLMGLGENYHMLLEIIKLTLLMI